MIELDTHSWTLADQYTVRTGSIAVQAMSGLNFPNTFALLQQHLQEEQDLQTLLQGLAGELERAVPLAGEDRPLRQALIRVRRDLLRQRLPRTSDLDLLRSSHPELCQRLEAARERLQKWLEAPLETQLQQEHLQVQGHLRQLLEQHPQLLSSLEISVPDFMDGVRDYLESGGGSGWRKLENTLVTYLSRAAFKTSPLSHFTGQALLSGGQSSQPRTQVLLNAALLHRMWQGMLQHPGLGGLLAYRWNPDCTPTEQGFSLLVLSAAGEVAADRWLQLAPSTGLMWVHQQTQAGEVGLQTLTERLHSRFQLDAQQARRFLDQLVEKKVLVPAGSWDDLTPSPLLHLQNLLRPLDCPLAARLSDQFRQMQDLLEQYGTANHQQRRSLLQDLQTRVTTVQELLQLDFPLPDPGRWLYENASSAAPAVPLPSFSSETVELLHDLAVLLSQVGLRTLQQHKDFVQRFGEGAEVSLPEYLLGKGNPDQNPDCATRLDRQMEALEQAALDFSSQLLHFVERHQHQPELEIPRALLQTLRPQLQPFKARGWTWLVQPHQNRWVVNVVSSGIGLIGLRCLDPNSRQVLQKRLARLHPGKVLQIRLTSQNTINHTPLVTEHSLGTLTSHASSSHRLHDLQVKHQPGAGLQVLDPQGKRVFPVFHSTLVPAFLPPTEQKLVQLQPQLNFRSYLVEAFSHSRPSDTVQHWPRLTLGEVVVSREAWVVPSPLLQRQKSETEVQHWRRMLQFWQQHQLPLVFFLSPGHKLFLQDVDIRVYFSKEHQLKPQFIDLRSLLYLRLLERWVRDCPTTLLYEAFPDPWQAEHTHLQELAIEWEQHHD